MSCFWASRRSCSTGFLAGWFVWSSAAWFVDGVLRDDGVVASVLPRVGPLSVPAVDCQCDSVLRLVSFLWFASSVWSVC